jgi:type VI secretion system VasD/TssJ family lipoprotein
MHPRFSSVIGAVVLTLLLATGCSGPMEMRVRGDDQMNGGGNPAVVRIYQLSGESSFTRATAADFWADDVAQISDELIGRPQDLTIYPGEQRSLTLEPSDDTQFIGFAADLRNPNRNQWRSIHPVSRLKGKTVTLEVLTDRLNVRF